MSESDDASSDLAITVLETIPEEAVEIRDIENSRKIFSRNQTFLGFSHPC